MDKKPLFAFIFILLAIFSTTPVFFNTFNKPVLVLGIPLLLAFYVGISLVALILWIVLYLFLYRHKRN